MNEMTEIPTWFYYVLLAVKYWYLTIPLAAYLVGFVWFVVKWKSAKIAVVWPLFLMFYTGQQ